MATETSTASTETVQQLVNTEQQQNPTPANEPIVQEDPKSQFNFASFDCGAVVRDSSKGSKGATAILSENKDQYLLNQCKAGGEMFVVIELCDEILIDYFQLANFEYFSSMIKDFTALVSNRYPPQRNTWIQIGRFRAHNTRNIQRFQIERSVVWAKFLMLRFESYYGNEFYCPLSLVRVYGRTMMQDLRQPPSSSSPSSPVASATQSTANTADSAPVGATGGNAITTTSPPIATVCHPTAAADPKLIAVPPAVLTYSWTELVPTAVVFEDFMKLPPQLDPVIPLQSQESATTPTETTTIAPPAATTLLAPIEATQPASETIAIIDQITANNVTTATLDSNQTMTTTTTPQPPVQQPAHNEDGEQHVDDPTENVFKSIITRVSRLEDNWQLHNQRLQESLHQLETIYRQRFDKFFTAFNQSSYYHLEQLRNNYDSIFLRISNDVRHLVGRIEFDLHDFRQQSTEISHQITGLQVWSAIQLLLFIVLAFWLRRRSLAAPQKHRPTTATADVAAPLQPTTPDSANKPPLKPFMVRIQNHFTWPVPRKTDSNSSGDEHLFRDGLESFSDLSPAQSQQQQQQKPLASTQSKRSKKKSKRRHSMPATS